MASATNNSSASNEDWKSGLRAPPKDDRPQTEGSNSSDMGLRRELLMGIFEAGFERPSPIQEEAIPVALTRRDILARAKNGTGKTAAFTIPSLQQVDPTKPKIQAMLLTPTRELALQTAQVCKNLGKHMGINVMVTTGGTTLKDDIIRLSEAVHVLVGTPGRILDLAGKQVADLSQCRVFVMDEADKLLSPEFTPVMEQLLSFVPSDRQVMLFSATFPMIVKQFKDKHMKSPHEINLMDELTLRGVTQYYAFVEERQKVHCLNTLFAKLQINQSIIFCNSTNRVELLAKKVTELGYRASTPTQKWFNPLAIAFFTISAMAYAATWSFGNLLASYWSLWPFWTSGSGINLITYDDRFNLYRIEQELGTEIQPIPAEINKSLYVAPSAIDEPAGQVPSNRGSGPESNNRSGTNGQPTDGQQPRNGGAHGGQGRGQPRGGHRGEGPTDAVQLPRDKSCEQMNMVFTIGVENYNQVVLISHASQWLILTPRKAFSINAGKPCKKFGPLSLFADPAQLQANSPCNDPERHLTIEKTAADSLCSAPTSQDLGIVLEVDPGLSCPLFVCPLETMGAPYRNHVLPAQLDQRRGPQVEPLAGCFRPENIARTSYNASWALDRPKRWEIQAGVPLRMGMDCYDFAGTVGRDKAQDTAEKHHTYFHTYWRKDLNPFGERQSWMLKSFFATQDLAHSTLILWYPSTIFQVRRVNVDQLAKGTSLEGSSLLHQRDKRAWVDGDLIRLLVTWAEGGIWIDMDSLLTRDLSPLLEHEFVTQWDCYDKLYTPLNGALMHFYKHSPYLCEAFHIIGTSPPPRPGTTDWGSSLYLKVWRGLFMRESNLSKSCHFVFLTVEVVVSTIGYLTPSKRTLRNGARSNHSGDKTGLAEGGELDVALGNVFSVHLHNQWEKAFPPGGWVERLLLNRYDSRLSRWKRSEVPPEEAS
ncbi:DEAD box helicase family [Rhizoctonia solani]|uniref:RNA helicase n=1 Tax=Rhizoctonia solani TaxID=456999 RepID=A0A8H7IJR9_9AGAM|nr:DEAD box helicase family [Rhizoctonia solani]